MTEKLHDPGLPPGEIVNSLTGGILVRNDGLKLSPAEKNPYYVLATVHGEYEKGSDWELTAKNRRIWNGWMCSKMSEDKRAKIAEQIGMEAVELTPLTPEEVRLAEAELAARTGTDQVIPEPGVVDLSGTHFSHTVIWEKCVFAGDAVFETAHFAGDALFDSAHFASSAYFSTAHFARFAAFSTAHFVGTADFYNAHFAEIAVFRGARSAAEFNFHNAHFAGPSCFDDAHFAGPAFFDDAAFKSRTDFADATFHGRTPSFFQCEMHDNTSFTMTPAQWPKVDPDEAGQDKSAYRRLRQVSASQHNPEAEHFFLRQEMACDAVLKEDWLSRFIVRSYGAVSGYGYSVARPGSVLLALWLGPALYFLTLFKVNFWSTLNPPDASHADALGSAAGFSFSNLFSFFGLGRRHFGDVWVTAPDLVHFIGGVQTVLGFVFLFFLGLGLRNRFRLK